MHQDGSFSYLCCSYQHFAVHKGKYLERKEAANLHGKKVDKEKQHNLKRSYGFQTIIFSQQMRHVFHS